MAVDISEARSFSAWDLERYIQGTAQGGERVYEGLVRRKPKVQWYSRGKENVDLRLHWQVPWMSVTRTTRAVFLPPLTNDHTSMLVVYHRRNLWIRQNVDPTVWNLLMFSAER